jgi:hypothetical protein
MPTAVHEPLNADGNGRQAYEVMKQFQDLKINVALFSETRLKHHMSVYIPKYIYRTDHLDGHKLPLQLRHPPHFGRLTPSPSSRSNWGLHTDWKH